MAKRTAGILPVGLIVAPRSIVRDSFGSLAFAARPPARDDIRVGVCKLQPANGNLPQNSRMFPERFRSKNVRASSAGFFVASSLGDDSYQCEGKYRE